MASIKVEPALERRVAPTAPYLNMLEAAQLYAPRILIPLVH